MHSILWELKRGIPVVIDHFISPISPIKYALLTHVGVHPSLRCYRNVYVTWWQDNWLNILGKEKKKFGLRLKMFSISPDLWDYFQCRGGCNLIYALPGTEQIHVGFVKATLNFLQWLMLCQPQLHIVQDITRRRGGELRSWRATYLRLRGTLWQCPSDRATCYILDI